MVSGWYLAGWYFCCCFSSGLVYSFSSSLYSEPIWGIYSPSVLLRDVLFLAVTTVCWNIWTLLYNGVSQPHYTWRKLCDGYPNACTGLCELASYKLWCLACHLHQVLSVYPRMVWTHLVLVLH